MSGPCTSPPRDHAQLVVIDSAVDKRAIANKAESLVSYFLVNGTHSIRSLQNDKRYAITVKLATFVHFLHEATVSQSIRFTPHLWPVAFILLPKPECLIQLAKYLLAIETPPQVSILCHSNTSYSAFYTLKTVS